MVDVLNDVLVSKESQIRLACAVWAFAFLGASFVPEVHGGVLVHHPQVYCLTWRIVTLNARILLQRECMEPILQWV